MIDRDIFFHKYKQHFGSLNQSQTDGINFLLKKLDESEILTDARHYAYILATIYHECAFTWQPIKEIGSQRYLQSKPYYPYFGRGFVQLTWKFNYVAFNHLVNSRFPDLEIMTNPDDALNPEAAWLITEEGMTKANLDITKEPNFVPGQTLERYLNESITDYISARRIINGTDSAHLIASYAINFYDSIEFTGSADEPVEVKAVAVNPVEPDPQIVSEELQAHQALIAEAVST